MYRFVTWILEKQEKQIAVLPTENWVSLCVFLLIPDRFLVLLFLYLLSIYYIEVACRHTGVILNTNIKIMPEFQDLRIWIMHKELSFNSLEWLIWNFQCLFLSGKCLFNDQCKYKQIRVFEWWALYCDITFYLLREITMQDSDRKIFLHWFTVLSVRSLKYDVVKWFCLNKAIKGIWSFHPT